MKKFPFSFWLILPFEYGAGVTHNVQEGVEGANDVHVEEGAGVTHDVQEGMEAAHHVDVPRQLQIFGKFILLERLVTLVLCLNFEFTFQ